MRINISVMVPETGKLACVGTTSGGSVGERGLTVVRVMLTMRWTTLDRWL